MVWDEHYQCSHSPKEIRKIELNKILKEKEVELKELRKQKGLKQNKHLVDEYKFKIDEFLKEIKPFREERSQLMKEKGKHVICAKRRYRWLKKPMGVLPEILTHLLETRTATKKEMKLVQIGRAHV